MKMLLLDGDCLCLFAKRLERGRFIWPKRTLAFIRPLRLLGGTLYCPARRYACSSVSDDEVAVSTSFLSVAISLGMILFLLANIFASIKQRMKQTWLDFLLIVFAAMFFLQRARQLIFAGMMTLARRIVQSLKTRVIRYAFSLQLILDRRSTDL